MARTLLVTSALPYSNGPIHIGHLAGAYLPADIFVRYQRMAGNHVVFICGADEHGVPIIIAAQQQGMTPQQLVDKYYVLNRDSFARFNIMFDNFSRTSLPIHHKTAQEFFLTLHKKHKLVVKTEQQLYCPQDKMFLADRYVRGTCPVCGNPNARGDQCERCGSWLEPIMLKEPRCAICGTTPVIKDTKHWYLPMGEFQAKLEAWLAEKHDWKDNVMNYCKGWFKEGLKERAITRDYDWGVPVPLPEGKGKALYVWFDAPIGYISSTKEWAARHGDAEQWKHYWCNPECEVIHFIGKDNIVFHAIFWPAMLMEVGGYNLPSQIPANEFLNIDGRKISTSQNYAVWLNEYVAKYPVDILRYTLAANLPETKDADFSWKQFQACNNDELADVLGNFVNRTLTFVQRYFDGVIPPAGALSAADNAVLAEVEKLGHEAGEMINTYRMRAAVARVMDIARAGNRYFDASQPWSTRKAHPKKCAAAMHVCCQVIRSLAVFLQPFIPETSDRMWRMLGMPGTPAKVRWNKAGKPGDIAGTKIGEISILFKKLEDADIQPEIDRLQEAVARIEAQERAAAAPAAATAPAASAAKEETVEAQQQISIEEFGKVQLRVAKVLTAEAVPKANKLLKLTVSLGDETRQVVAGIAKHYEPSALVGKYVVLVANLKPAVLRGIESHGMILAAEDENGLALVTLDRDVTPGSKVK